MVAAGSGITLLPDLAVPQAQKRDGVCYLDCTSPNPSRSLFWLIARIAFA